MRKFKLKSKFIRNKMKQRHLTERDLAKMVGTSQALVHYWLSRESASGAILIARAMKLNAKDLIK